LGVVVLVGAMHYIEDIKDREFYLAFLESFDQLRNVLRIVQQKLGRLSTAIHVQVLLQQVRITRILAEEQMAEPPPSECWIVFSLDQGAAHLTRNLEIEPVATQCERDAKIDCSPTLAALRNCTEEPIGTAFDDLFNQPIYFEWRCIHEGRRRHEQSAIALSRMLCGCFADLGQELLRCVRLQKVADVTLLRQVRQRDDLYAGRIRVDGACNLFCMLPSWFVVVGQDERYIGDEDRQSRHCFEREDS